MKSLHTYSALLILVAAVAGVGATRNKTTLQTALGAFANHSIEVPASGRLEVAFSPNEGSERLVVKVIDSAQSELRILAYSFTSAPVVDALLRAKRRRVDIKVVADYKENIVDDHSGKARAALNALATAGIDVRTIAAYPIHHDKLLVSDRQTVEVGSFNYSAAAATRNSENVLVNWDNVNLAAVYLSHFERNYAQSQAFQSSY